jgi:hypothetical protein
MSEDDMILIAPERKSEGFRRCARAATGAAR